MKKKQNGTLYLPIKEHWTQMILAGEKTENFFSYLFIFISPNTATDIRLTFYFYCFIFVEQNCTLQ